MLHFRFFLQHPANPDLLYIIFFCHSQLTITILLILIFASKVSDLPFFVCLRVLAASSGAGPSLGGRLRRER